MKERLLADFFGGRVTARQLAGDLEGAYVQRSHDAREFDVEPMSETFVVTRDCMLRACWAVLDGDLDPGLLEPVGDCLMMSETFRFDEADQELLSDIAHSWGTPEICYPLDRSHVEMFREWLVSGQKTLK